MAETGTEEAGKDEALVPLLSRLRPPPGAVRSRRRRGRGPGSGLGKTGGKGQKGQKARHPGDFGKLGFEGGQMPMQRRLPKLGFHNPFSKRVENVNVSDLARFDAGSRVTVEMLLEAGLIRKHYDAVKVLGDGEIAVALTVEAHAFSKGARSKIEAAGGTAIEVETHPKSDGDQDSDEGTATPTE